MPDSFLFYDLETFGTDACKTRIAQFAALRTDLELHIVEQPISFFVRPADDLLPSPTSTLITGITPQQAWRDGLNEAAAFAIIHEEMSRPQTCSLGYNSLRFDDQFIRCGLYRNFYDPYEREWRGGNSRWDLLDVMRLAHALRPEGLSWPLREDGATSFKLEHLADANDVREGTAHEALSDVRMLLGIAGKLRATQPRLWDYALRLRDKRYVASKLDTIAMQPVLHISQRYAAARYCAAPVVPLTFHPHIDHRVIAFDLDSDPTSLLELDADAIADRLYTPQADLPDGVTRIALKEIHLNRCPVVVDWVYLRMPDLQRLHIDPDTVAHRAKILRDAGPALGEKVRQVYAQNQRTAATDVDAALYDGWIDDVDRKKFPRLRSTPPHALAETEFAFRDQRLPELLFRYRARNWPETLTFAEQERWNAYRRQRLQVDRDKSEYTFASFHAELDALRLAHVDQNEQLALLDQLEAWGRSIAVSLI